MLLLIVHFCLLFLLILQCKWCNFVCKSCTAGGLITNTTGFNEELDAGSRVLPEKLDKFCCLRDILNESGRCDSL